MIPNLNATDGTNRPLEFCRWCQIHLAIKGKRCVVCADSYRKENR